MRGYHICIIIDKTAPGITTTFIPSRLFQRLPAHKPSPTIRRNPQSHYKNKDYRLGPLKIDWVDFEDMSKTSNSAGKAGEKSSRGTAEATFIPRVRTKSGLTNLTEGVVHVFRDSENKRPLEDTATIDIAEGVMLGVLAVPSWMTPSDFLTFIAPAAEGIAHLRLIHASVPNHSLAILKFSNASNATEFLEAYNGKPFNSMEPEICNVVNVLSVIIDTDDLVSQAISRFGSAQSSVYELPTCPVCLERMDSAITGLITVPCSHTFHCTCLSKWGDSRCPVCRYSQTLRSSHPSSSSGRSAVPIPFSNPSASTPSSCSSCSSITNLWICLICGNIGCGRYGLGHAHAHYQITTHLYALELETQRVWDYAGDGYVHRLIQNRADGKLVELPSAASSTGVPPRDGSLGPSQADALSAEKIEAIGIEYSYLLTSQLDSQRSYYEEQTSELRSQVEELKLLVERLGAKFEKERKEMDEELLRKIEDKESRLVEVLKDKARAEARAEKATELAKRVDKELKEERAVSEGLMRNIGKMKEKVDSASEEKQQYLAKIQDLEEQLRDVMLSLDINSKIEQGGGMEAELAGGSVEIPIVPRPESKKKKPRKR